VVGFDRLIWVGLSCAGRPGVVIPIHCFRVRVKLPETGQFSKPVELDGIKIWIIELFPDAEELDRASGSGASSG